MRWLRELKWSLKKLPARDRKLQGNRLKRIERAIAPTLAKETRLSAIAKRLRSSIKRDRQRDQKALSIFSSKFTQDLTHFIRKSDGLDLLFKIDELTEEIEKFSKNSKLNLKQGDLGRCLSLLDKRSKLTEKFRQQQMILSSIKLQLKGLPPIPNTPDIRVGIMRVPSQLNGLIDNILMCRQRQEADLINGIVRKVRSCRNGDKAAQKALYLDLKNYFQSLRYGKYKSWFKEISDCDDWPTDKKKELIEQICIAKFMEAIKTIQKSRLRSCFGWIKTEIFHSLKKHQIDKQKYLNQHIQLPFDQSEGEDEVENKKLTEFIREIDIVRDQETGKEGLLIQQAARLASMGTQTLRDWIKKKLLPERWILLNGKHYRGFLKEEWSDVKDQIEKTKDLMRSRKRHNPINTRFLTLRDAAIVLRVSKRTLLRYIVKGIIPLPNEGKNKTKFYTAKQMRSLVKQFKIKNI